MYFTKEMYHPLTKNIRIFEEKLKVKSKITPKLFRQRFILSLNKPLDQEVFISYLQTFY